MKRVIEYVKTIKSLAGMVGAGLMSGAAVAGAPWWMLLAGSILTGIAVYEFPYQPEETTDG